MDETDVYIIVAVIIGLAIFLIIVLIVALFKNGDRDNQNSNSDSHNIDHFIKPPLDKNGEIITYNEYIGQHAEEKVNEALKVIMKDLPGSKLISNIIIPSSKDRYKNKYTNEIDHILITKSGVFVIETKSRAGHIRGDINDDKWTQILGYENDIRHTFYNPLKQNETHVRVLKRWLRNDNLVCFPVVVFVEGNIFEIDSDDVINLSDLENYIYDKTDRDIYNNQFIQVLYNRLLYIKEHPPKSNKEHAKEVQDYYS